MKFSVVHSNGPKHAYKILLGKRDVEEYVRKASVFAKQQAACELNKLAYSAQLQKGKGMGLDEAAQACSHDDRHEWT